MCNYIFKKLVSTILFVICIEILICSIGVNSVASSINNKTIEYMSDNEIIFNQYFGRSIRRIYVIGPIDNLSIDGDDYEFYSKNLRRLHIYRSWGPGGWEFSIWYAHNRRIYVGIGGLKFHGILKPNFICGCFHNQPWS